MTDTPDDRVERVARAIALDDHDIDADTWDELEATDKEVCDDYRSMARAALAAADQWLPIESAPRDGTRVLTYSPSKGGTVDVMRFHRPAAPKARAFWVGAGQSRQPTHFRPLPQPPEAK